MRNLSVINGLVADRQEESDSLDAVLAGRAADPGRPPLTPGRLGAGRRG